MTRKSKGSKLKSKQSAHLKKNKRNTRLFVLGVALVISLTVLGIGLLATTQATLKDSDNKTNNFSYGDLKAELVEEFVPEKDIQVGSTYEKKVSVKNTGEVATFVRVLVLPEILSKKSAEGVPVLLPSMIGKELDLLDEGGSPISNSSVWQNGQDGFYYYLKKLKPGETTEKLFNSVKLIGNLIETDSMYEEATLDIHVKVEGVHTTQFAYRDGWWQGTIPTESSRIVVDNALKVIAH